MSALFIHIEPADDPNFVWLRTSASPGPERKPALLVARIELNVVMLMLLDAAQTGAGTC
ncbi:hypothetical protein [Paraburkholderia pallida]|uniref:hypothetical protein n=1 Tax=Paraburkholderia pallida TaxID=2547399 RepID=UPI00142F7550|nr:hypothetical protein [Paraburkholderia pallida]